MSAAHKPHSSPVMDIGIEGIREIEKWLPRAEESTARERLRQLAADRDEAWRRVHALEDESLEPEPLVDVIRAERAFLLASRNVWYEIDRLSSQPGGYKGLSSETDLRLIEREAWERYRDACDTADVMICPRCDGQQYDRGSCAVCENTGYARVGDS